MYVASSLRGIVRVSGLLAQTIIAGGEIVATFASPAVNFRAPSFVPPFHKFTREFLPKLRKKVGACVRMSKKVITALKCPIGYVQN